MPTAFSDPLYLDGYQFLLTLAGHADRHSQQIAEVKATAGYPK